MGISRHTLTIIGDVGVDLVLGPVAGWPQWGTEILVDRHEMRAGGSGANAALAASFLGGTSRLIAAVGNDDLGRWLRAELTPLGASIDALDCATTLSVGILHAGGDRCFFTTRGHLEQISYAHVRAHLTHSPQPNAMVLLSGVFLTPQLRSSYPALIEELRSLGYQVAIDTNWPPENWTTAVREEMRGWIGCCDHVLLNDLEVAGLTDTQDLPLAIKQLTRHLKPGATLVIKQGAGGALAIQNDKRVEAPATALPIFDTIGAGDSFNAGYLMARSQGLPLAEALAAACQGASSIIARFPRRSLSAGALASVFAPRSSVQSVAS
jgi:ribokinase